MIYDGMYEAFGRGVVQLVSQNPVLVLLCIYVMLLRWQLWCSHRIVNRLRSKLGATVFEQEYDTNPLTNLSRRIFQKVTALKARILYPHSPRFSRVEH